MCLVSLARVCVLSSVLSYHCTVSLFVFTADYNNCLSVLDKKINHAWISQTGDNKKNCSYVVPLFYVSTYYTIIILCQLYKMS